MVRGRAIQARPLCCGAGRGGQGKENSDDRYKRLAGTLVLRENGYICNWNDKRDVPLPNRQEQGDYI